MLGTSVLVSDTEEEGPGCERCLAAGWAATPGVFHPTVPSPGLMMWDEEPLLWGNSES